MPHSSQAPAHEREQNSVSQSSEQSKPVHETALQREAVIAEPERKPEPAPEPELAKSETGQVPENQPPASEPEDSFIDSAIDAMRLKLKKQTKQKTSQIPRVKDDFMVKIEKILEEGLEDAYRELSPAEQQEFKIKGEETAWEIKQAVQKAKVRVKEIFLLIVKWLSMLPGVNNFFAEQEAKIKADKIISLKKISK